MNNYTWKISKIPKSIKVFFVIIHIIYGYDFGFINLSQKKIASLFKYYSLVLTIIIFIALFIFFKLLRGEVWFWVNFIENIVYLCILKSVKYNVYNLLSDIHVAERIAVLEKETFGVITATCAISVYIGKAEIFSCHLYSNENHNIFNRLTPIGLVIYLLFVLGKDFIHACELVIYHYIYTYVKNMKSSLKQYEDIDNFFARYNKIADCYDKIRHLCDNIVSRLSIIVVAPVNL